MAEIKNSFLRSKMNKDLDDRLIPNGEYRDAQNISVGKSEADDIGALETVLGNLIQSPTISPVLPNNIKIIGYLSDEYSSNIYIFATTYTDSNPNEAPTYATSIERCVIYSWLAGAGTAKLIADGIFLNFSTTNPIQVSLIENLLFFTDNRNQPRKVNINNPTGYYKEESQISVAKYSPYQAISLFKKAESVVVSSANTDNWTDIVSTARIANTQIVGGDLTITPSQRFATYGASTIKCTVNNVTVATDGITDAKILSLTTQAGGGGVSAKQQYNFAINTTTAVGDVLQFIVPGATNSILLTTVAGIEVGMSIISTSSTGTVKIKSSFYITVTAVNVATKTITISSSVTVAPGDLFTFLTSTMTNESATPNWPGDPDYLEGRYVRFSYRYRFDDGEYSIMAPFTQIAYIPKQKGYFKNGNEDDAFRSTIVEWMENNTNNVQLLITLPDKASNLGVIPASKYKIQSLDILFKESDALAVKVLETIDLNGIAAGSTNNIFIYNYQSRKPYKTLPQDQTTRVFDKVPVRALSQETAGNRIMYGNFRDIYTAPLFIEYDVKVVDKGSKLSTSWAEYPNHTLKQNRNYQVGFILADKYGRQSSVILSPVSTTVSNDFLGSTLFLPYNNETNQGTIKDWFGQTLQLSITKSISSGINGYPNFSNGQPGLYAIPTGTNGFAVKQTPVTVITDTDYKFTLDSTAYPGNVTVPVEGDYLRGEYEDYVEVSGAVTNDGAAFPRYTVPTNGRVNSIYANNTTITSSPDTKFAYKINPVGWYSYKVVVKQTEQDYYNVYLPGILKGYPDQTGVADNPPPFPGLSTDPLGSTSNIILINDNINKVPRDLAEVGPDQKQFRSSVQLSGRVENTLTNSVASNKQIYPGIKTDTAISIATTSDSNMQFEHLSAQGQANLYQIDTKPLIARLSTTAAIGVSSTTSNTTNMVPFLAIYETEPVDSLLDIFWETGTVGLIADLNADVNTGFDGPVSFTTKNFQLLESDASGHAVTSYFYPVSNEGTSFDSAYPTTAVMTVTSVRDEESADAFFTLEQDTDNTSGTFKAYRIKTNSLFTYLQDSITQDVYTFNITVTVDAGSSLAPGVVQTISFQGSLSNVTPSFVESTLPTINITVDQTGSIGTGLTAYGQDTEAVNGTNSANLTTNKEAELKWTIVSGNPTGNDSLPAYNIVQSGVNGGNLTQRANNTPSGQHTLVLKIEDCNGTANVGGLNANLNQIINVGPIATNSGIGENVCIKGPVNAAIGIPAFPALVTKRTATQGITGVWYLAGTAFTSGGTGGYNISNLPVQPSTAQTGDASLTNTLFRLGSSTLTKGTLAFSLNCGFQWSTTQPPGPAGLQANLQWRVWHRANSTSAWAAVADINNYTINNSPTGQINSGAIQVTFNTAATGVLGDFYDQRVLAYDKVGEYAIAAYNANTTVSYTQSESMTCWVNSNDLYYSTCVIENGVNITSGTAKSYEYEIDLAGSSANYCPNYISGTSVYSHVPYGQYITQLYSSSNLSSIFAVTGVAGVTNYKAFVTAGASPYYRNSQPQKYIFSARFSTTTSKTYEPSPASSCYVQACSTSGCNPNIYLYPFSA